jgi:hypothetical protein
MWLFTKLLQDFRSILVLLYYKPTQLMIVTNDIPSISILISLQMTLQRKEGQKPQN